MSKIDRRKWWMNGREHQENVCHWGKNDILSASGFFSNEKGLSILKREKGEKKRNIVNLNNKSNDDGLDRRCFSSIILFYLLDWQERHDRVNRFLSVSFVRCKTD